ncbi:MAG: 3'-5' exonuclease [Isosphaeraceae bacterium]
MTIHQSKGLEFPIVVVPDLNRKGRPGATEGLALDDALGPVVRVRSGSTAATDAEGEEGSGGSIGWRVYSLLEQEEDSAELLRLFYVATTRARDALVLSAGSGRTQARIRADATPG